MSDAPHFFDCSGFVKYIFAQVGYELPRSTIEQAEFAGRQINSLKEIAPCDVIFLHGERGHYNSKFLEGIGHVVVYMGNGQVIHAGSKRTSEYPEKIIEKGEVKVSSLDKALKNSGPIVVIKRILD